MTNYDLAEVVTVRNGTRHRRGTVHVIMVSLYNLMREYGMPFYELVMICRNPNHRLFGNSAEVLKSFSLLEADGQPHDVIRDVVLSAAVGEDLGLSLCWPIEGEEGWQ